MSGAPLRASCALAACVLPHCPAARGGRMDTSCGPAFASHPTHQKGEVSERRKSTPYSCFGCSSHISVLSAAQATEPCAGCWGRAGPMERPVKDGILYVQHCKFGKRTWRKMRAQLFAASPSGVARMEKFDARDDGTVPDISLRRCARRVIRLSDCVSVGPAGTESCPKATAAFYLTTTEKSYVLAAEQRDEWIEHLCQLAFQGKKEAAQSSSTGLQPIPMEENCLYSSWQDLTEFPVLVLQTEAAARCELHGHYVLAALPHSLTLKDAQSQQPLLTWPYPFLRKFGQDQNIFSFEAGRRSDSGEGTFTFSTPRAPELCRAVATAIACQQQAQEGPQPRLSAQGLAAQPWGAEAEDPQPSPTLGRAQPSSHSASHPPPNLLRFHAAEPEAAVPVVYASIARGQQPHFGLCPGKPLPEHLYENIFTAQPRPRAEEEEEEEEGRWELGCRQAPEGHSSEAALSYGAPQPHRQRWGPGASRGGAEEHPGPKPQRSLRAKLVRLLSRDGTGARDWS
ncbi:docking protein 3 isoform X2 [Numida meleagris]|uniref:docking protein 3 isoform X2 n=1 Tax=Numida meleagris TaxID=8996 RepID=UPI000B3DC134|nr:docking protein 3 isoform X2 [Numida meleagris]